MTSLTFSFFFLLSLREGERERRCIITGLLGLILIYRVRVPSNRSVCRPGLQYVRLCSFQLSILLRGPQPQGAGLPICYCTSRIYCDHEAPLAKYVHPEDLPGRRQPRTAIYSSDRHDSMIQSKLRPLPGSKTVNHHKRVF
jgi:hypothetical protein